MSNEMIPSQGSALVPADNPVSRTLTAGHAPGLNVGAVTIETERAIAEARGQMQLAKMFPRDLNAAYAELMDACKLPALAEVAFYTRKQGNGNISGPSIRLAEEIARVVGNFEYGHRELSRTEAGSGPKDFGRSEVEVYAWDKEKNNRSPRQITVMHLIDTQDGPRKLRGQNDIDNKIANVAAKQMRGRILALLPKWMVESAVQECRKTLAGNNEVPLSERVRRMTQAFAKFGVSTEHLEKYLEKKLDAILADELVDLQGIYNALKEGAPASEYFGAQDDPDDKQQAPAAAAISQQVKESNAAPSKPAAQPRATRTRSSTNGKPTESNAPQNKDSQSESGQKSEAQPTDTPPAAAQPSSTEASPNPSPAPVEDDPF